MVLPDFIHFYLNSKSVAKKLNIGIGEENLKIRKQILPILYETFEKYDLQIPVSLGDLIADYTLIEKGDMYEALCGFKQQGTLIFNDYHDRDSIRLSKETGFKLGRDYWWPCQILETVDDAAKVKVHFVGYSEKWDAQIDTKILRQKCMPNIRNISQLHPEDEVQARLWQITSKQKKNESYCWVHSVITKIIDKNSVQITISQSLDENISKETLLKFEEHPYFNQAIVKISEIYKPSR